MIKKILIGICVLALTACGGGGGGSSAPQVEPGPPPANGPVPPPAPVQPSPAPTDFDTADGIIASVTGVTISSPPVVDFQVTDSHGIAITGLTSSDIRFTIAKLVPGENGSASYWQSYINTTNNGEIEATYERGGELVNHGDGTYTYTFLTDVTNVTDPIAVTYDPDLTHRVAMQFGGDNPANPTYDFVPATGATSGIETRNIVTVASCNSCHDKLAMHGGGRVETEYCVTCHNPGTKDPQGVSVDFKVMIHKIHRGANLPSVQNGDPYVIIGYHDSVHDYSDVNFPQDIRHCTKCHAGTATDPGDPLELGAPNTVVPTSDGDNWNEVPTRAACGSCHDNVDFSLHMGGQSDDSACLSCHSEGGAVGSIASVHETPVDDAIPNYKVNIISIANTAPGDAPQVTFSVTNPNNGDAAYDITSLDRLRMSVAWENTDYTNEGDGSAESTPESTDAIANAVSNGDGTYTLTSDVAIPDPFAADSSGTIVFEGRDAINTSSDPQNPQIEEVPLTFGVGYFSINEADGQADPRRQVVSIDKCNACHYIKTQHGNNRANDTQGCVTCHNPRLTDREVRELNANDGNPNNDPTDGKNEESIVFSRLIHGVHAAAIRQNPLQVVGYGGFSTHVFDEEEVQFPGHLNDCRNCHVDGGWRLPLADGVLAPTIDTGADLADRSDDVMITPIASACSSCHDSDQAKIHMEHNGGDFTATAASISSGASTEACTVCHGEGRIADLDVVHNLND